MLIRTKLTIVQSGIVAVALAATFAVLYASFSALVSEKDDALYRERLAGVLAQLEAEHASLAKTGLADVEAYVQGAQKSVLEALASRAGGRAAGDVTLFVANDAGSVLLFPGREPGGGRGPGSPPGAVRRGPLLPRRGVGE